MIQFKEYAWTDGQKEGQTLFYMTLLATAGTPKREFKKTVVEFRILYTRNTTLYQVSFKAKNFWNLGQSLPKKGILGEILGKQLSIHNQHPWIP